MLPNLVRLRTSLGHAATRMMAFRPQFCAHRGSATHRTGSGNGSNFCELCNTAGHRQKRGDCPFRECSSCKAVEHSAHACVQSTLSNRAANGTAGHTPSKCPVCTRALRPVWPRSRGMSVHNGCRQRTPRRNRARLVGDDIDTNDALVSPWTQPRGGLDPQATAGCAHTALWPSHVQDSRRSGRIAQDAAHYYS